MPPADVVTEKAESYLRYELHDLIVQVANIDAVVDSLLARGGFTQVTPAALRSWLADNELKSWSDGTFNLVSGDVESQIARLIPGSAPCSAGSHPGDADPYHRRRDGSPGTNNTPDRGRKEFHDGTHRQRDHSARRSC